MSERVVIAYSGGLDTSWCIPHLKQTLDVDVVTVTVDVGGMDADERAALAARSRELGASEHLHVDAKDLFFDEILKFLLMGNVLRGQVYPLCVGAERSLQAREVARVARQVGSQENPPKKAGSRKTTCASSRPRHYSMVTTRPST